MAASISQLIKVTYKAGLQIITISRPKRLNAINREMYDALLALLDYGSKSDEVLFTVITAEGKFFSSGNDFGDMGDNIENAILKFRNVCDALIDYPKVLVAVVNGPAIGIGFTMLGLFDVVYASTKAYFQAPFSKVGVNAECCSSILFPRIFGPSKAMEFMAFAEKLTATQALNYGFVSELLTEQQMKTEIWDRLVGYTKLSINSMMATKKLVRDSDRELFHKTNVKEAESILNMLMTEDTINRLFSQFKSKV